MCVSAAAAGIDSECVFGARFPTKERHYAAAGRPPGLGDAMGVAAGESAPVTALPSTARNLACLDGRQSGRWWLPQRWNRILVQETKFRTWIPPVRILTIPRREFEVQPIRIF
jgi:hypothetical protein